MTSWDDNDKPSAPNLLMSTTSQSGSALTQINNLTLKAIETQQGSEYQPNVSFQVRNSTINGNACTLINIGIPVQAGNAVQAGNGNSEIETENYLQHFRPYTEESLSQDGPKHGETLSVQDEAQRINHYWDGRRIYFYFSVFVLFFSLILYISLHVYTTQKEEEDQAEALKFVQLRLKNYYQSMTLPALPMDQENTRVPIENYVPLRLQILDRSVNKHILKDNITLEEVFLSDDVTVQPYKRILVESEPGFGKTMFSAKLCSEWARNRSSAYSKFSLCVFLPLKELHRNQKVETALLQKIGQSGKGNQREMPSDVVSRMLTPVKDNILIVLDDYGKLRLEEAESVLDFLESQFFLESTIIVTSYPSVKLGNFFQRIVRIVGFTEENLKKLVGSILPSDEIYRNMVLDFLEETEVSFLRQISALHVYMVCYVCKKAIPLNSLETLREKYSFMERVTDLVRTTCKATLEDFLNFGEFFHIHSIKLDKSVFPEKDVRSILGTDKLNVLKNCGLLRLSPSQFGVAGEEKLEIPHSQFSRFLSVQYLRHAWGKLYTDEERKSFIN